MKTKQMTIVLQIKINPNTLLNLYLNYHKLWKKVAAMVQLICLKF